MRSCCRTWGAQTRHQKSHIRAFYLQNKTRGKNFQGIEWNKWSLLNFVVSQCRDRDRLHVDAVCQRPRAEHLSQKCGKKTQSLINFIFAEISVEGKKSLFRSVVFYFLYFHSPANQHRRKNLWIFWNL